MKENGKYLIKKGGLELRLAGVDDYYRGTRFDRLGVFTSIRCCGFEYAGQWFGAIDADLDPYRHDNVCGTPEEFAPFWMEDGRCVRVGVGVLNIPDEAHYQRFVLSDILCAGCYEVSAEPARTDVPRPSSPENVAVEPARTDDTHIPNLESISSEPAGECKKLGYKDVGEYHKLGAKGNNDSDQPLQSLTYRHLLPGIYDYSKRIVALDENSFAIEHSLTNLSQQAIVTDCYNHNFFTFETDCVGPERELFFGEGIGGDWRPDSTSKAFLRNGRLGFTAPLVNGEVAFIGNLRFANLQASTQSQPVQATLQSQTIAQSQSSVQANPMADPQANIQDQSQYYPNPQIGSQPNPHAIPQGYHLVVRNAERVVTIDCDRPLDHAVTWSNYRVACAEPYVAINLAPAATFTWRIVYRFA